MDGRRRPSSDLSPKCAMSRVRQAHFKSKSFKSILPRDRQVQTPFSFFPLLSHGPWRTVRLFRGSVMFGPSRIRDRLLRGSGDEGATFCCASRDKKVTPVSSQETGGYQCFFARGRCQAMAKSIFSAEPMTVIGYRVCKLANNSRWQCHEDYNRWDRSVKQPERGSFEYRKGLPASESSLEAGEARESWAGPKSSTPAKLTAYSQQKRKRQNRLRPNPVRPPHPFTVPVVPVAQTASSDLARESSTNTNHFGNGADQGVEGDILGLLAWRPRAKNVKPAAQKDLRPPPEYAKERYDEDPEATENDCADIGNGFACTKKTKMMLTCCKR